MSVRFSRLLATIGCVVICATLCPPILAAKDAKSAKDTSVKYDVPEGTPEELLAFIKKVQQSRVEATTTRAQRMELLRNVHQAIATAAERIISAKPEETTEIAAVKAAIESLTVLKRLGDDQAAKKLDALNESLKNDKRPAIVNMLKFQLLERQQAKLKIDDLKSVESFATGVNELLHATPPEAKMLSLAQDAMRGLYQQQRDDDAIKMGQEFSKLFVESDDVETASKSLDLIIPTAQMLWRADKSKDAAAFIRRCAEQLAKRKELPLQGLAAELTLKMGPQIERRGNELEAADLYRQISKRLAGSDEPALQEVVEQFEKSVRKLEVVGHEMPISGKQLGGGQFDSSKYKGKVVLVDFWATWCGPCLAELPNVKETYKKYHGRGFEVVGISLDDADNVDQLKEFIKEKQIPWPILFEGDEEASGFEHPMAKRYSIDALPTAVVIDRQGKVVTLSAYGERLGELVEQLLGGQASGDTSKTKKKAG